MQRKRMAARLECFYELGFASNSRSMEYKQTYDCTGTSSDVALNGGDTRTIIL